MCMADEQKKQNPKNFDLGVLGRGSSKGKLPMKNPKRNSSVSNKSSGFDNVKNPKKEISKKESNNALSNIVGRKVEKKDFKVPKRGSDESKIKPTTSKKLSPSELVKETEKIAKEMLKEGKC